MFDIGDEVVCIRVPSDKEYRRAAFFYKDTPSQRLQIGVVYTIADVHVFEHAFKGHGVGVELSEIPIWWWSSLLFRKVKKIEEPKKLVVDEGVPELV